MTSKKNTRRALLSSVIALILCCSMLVGTTFAWFTDEVKSLSNVITAGNLDVDVVTADGESVHGKANLFNEIDLWEPGVVAYETLTVQNNGTLALKYQMDLNFTNATAFEGKTLVDVLKVGVVEGIVAENVARADLIAAVNGNWQSLESFSINGQLAGGEDADPVTLVIYWEPGTSEFDNLFNMNNGKNTTLSIDFGVHVFATQVEAESDSFGPDYDEEAIYTDFLVTNEEELVAALANAQDGAIIGIQGNVTWTTGAGIGSTPFIENVTTFAATSAPVKNITLLGIGADATFTAIGQGVGAIGIDGGTVTFKNLTIADQSVSYAENSWEYGYLEFRGNTVFENCDVINAIMMEGESATFVNCTFNSHDNNQYGVWVSDGNASFENCTFTGARGLKMHEAYGSEVGTVEVNNCTFVELSKKPGLALGTLNAETSVVMTNNEFIGTQAGDQGLYSYETDTAVDTINFTYENNKVYAQDGTLAQGLYKVDESTWMATNLNAFTSGVNSAVEGDTVILAQDVTYTGNGYLNLTKDITVDLNGNTLSTTSLGVVAKAGTIKNGTVANPEGKRAALRTWSGVSIEDVTVISPYNGGITVASGNTLPYIKNVTIVAETYGIELQNYASVGTIENVTIVAGKNGIVAQAATVGEIINCSIEGGETGIWGQLKGTEDLKLTVTNSVVIGGNYGMYIGDEGATIVPNGIAYVNYDEASVFTGSVKAQEYAFGQSGKLVINGAKVGAFISNAEELFAFAKAVNEEGKNFKGLTVFLTADIDLENALWTPVGQTGATEFKGVFDGQNHTISNLNIDSSAQTGKHYSSGLFGWAESNVTIKNVKIDGATVVGNHNVAVLVGYTYSAKISNCHVTNATIVCNHANGDACGDKCGLIGGYVGDEARVSNCSASNSTVKAGRDGGQLIGAGYNVSVSDCSATNVTVTANGSCPEEKNINNAIIGRVLG